MFAINKNRLPINGVAYFLCVLFAMLLIYSVLVELTGVEPVSKQGSNMLSTCLSSPLVFVYRQDRSHQPIAYLLKTSKSPRSPTPSISDIPYTSLPNRLGERHLRDVSLQHLCRN